MAWFLVVFWLVLAALYLVLGVVSWLFSRSFGKRLHLAQQKYPMVLQRDGTMTMGGLPKRRGSSHSKDSSESEDDVVMDYWRDLGAYLDKTTAINMVGFVLAGLAAIVSYLVLQ
jgi:hypothetical protein